MESGLRAASTQLENRQRRFGLRLLSLPQGDQGWEVVGASVLHSPVRPSWASDGTT